MAAVILPFRFSRRLPQIQKTAAFMVTVPHGHAEAHLREQIRRLTDGLRKKGVTDERVRSEAASYEAAVRSHLWGLLLGTGGVA